MAQNTYTYEEFSGGVQRMTSPHIKKPNELVGALNNDFSKKLGAMVRRAGSQKYGNPMAGSKPVTGSYIARFQTGAELWAASENATDATKTTLRKYVGPGWTDIKNDLIDNADVYMMDDLDEVWVSTYDKLNDLIGTPFTINSAGSISETRQLQFAPKARFYMEFNGAVYAANVDVGGTRYRDRVYKSSGPTGVITYSRAPSTLTVASAAATAYSLPLDVDSARYLKPTQEIDVYAAGTNNLIYQLTIASVDKINDTVTFTNPETVGVASASINTTSNEITVATNTWMQTGTAVSYFSGGVATPLVNATVYYVIRVSSTQIKLATSYANALAGTAIDITAQGTGTHTLTRALVFSNKDEIWKRDRKGKLTRFWNTDYRNPEDSDYLLLPPTMDAANDITGIGKLIGRMMIFTRNAMIQFDGQNLITLRNDVGCSAWRTICYYDNFMVWMDSVGQVWIRNGEDGSQDIISFAVADIIAKFDQTQLDLASAVVTGKYMKLTIGSADGVSTRLVYNFQANNWTVEEFDVVILNQLRMTYNNVVKPIFIDNESQVWIDEEGTTDDGNEIPFIGELGDDTFGVDEKKKYIGIKVYGANVAGTKMMASVDAGQFIDVGEIKTPVASVQFPKTIPEGTMINVKFVNSSSGEPVEIHKAKVFYTRVEDTFNATRG
jgi:hypothetical protein